MSTVGKNGKEQDWQRLLDTALEHVDVDPNCGVGLEGSLAEGFGNETSDIDFICIEDSDREFPTMPTMLFLEGQRVEVRVRSKAQLRRQAAELFRLAKGGRRGVLQIDEVLLDRCQRFTGATVLRNPELIASVREALPLPELADVISKWFAVHARDAAHCAVALSSLGCTSEAVSWARSALTLGAKSWLATRNETYLPKKWISLQLVRARDEGGIAQRAESLESPRRAGFSGEKYVAEVVEFLPKLGVKGVAFDPLKLSLRRRPDITTWPLGTRIHVVRQRSDIFAFSSRAARIWQSLALRVPLPHALAAADDPEKIAGTLVAELHSLGLIDIVWQGDGEIRARGTVAAAPLVNQPILSTSGAVLGGPNAPDIALMPIPADRFAAAGMELAYVSQIIENAQEDARGAVGAKQWRVLERAAQRMVRHTCVALLCAYGVNPLPPQEEVHAFVRRSLPLPAGIKRALGHLENEIRIDDVQQAENVLESVNVLVEHMRQFIRSEFPACFDSAAEWQQTLDLGLDWVRLGAYLNAKFPLEQVRDLLTSGGQQPQPAKPRSQAAHHDQRAETSQGA